MLRHDTDVLTECRPPARGNRGAEREGKGAIVRIERAYRPDAEREQRVLRRFIRLAQEAVDQRRDKRDTDSRLTCEKPDCTQASHAPAE
jgi:hypothetical protein